MRIGIDFDNTIVSYGALFSRTAMTFGFLHAPHAEKTSVRDALRALPEGEAKWRRLQAVVYGPAMAEAQPFPGVREFLLAARAAGAELYLVSHKTLELRASAEAWLHANAFLGRHAFDAANVFFEATRSEKIARLALLRCTHAVDDLAEVFAEPDFPPCERLLFAPGGAPEGPWRRFASWDELRVALFARG